MKRFAVPLFLLALVAAPVTAQVATWTIDSAHSGAHFAVKHMLISTVRGDFDRMKGAIQLDPADITKSSVEAVIETTSISTREMKRDDHLRSADFFDVAKFPTITFKSKRVERAGQGRLKVIGDLTVKDVTREVVLDVEGPSQEIKDQRGNTRIGATATTRINRKDFGITWSRTMDGGGLVVGDDVQITIEIEAIRRAPQPTAAATQ